MKTRTYSYGSDSPRVSAKSVACWLEIIAKRFGPILSVAYYEDGDEHVIEVAVEEEEND